MRRFVIAACVLVLTLPLARCGDDDPNGPKTYSTSDLSGTWLGVLSITLDGLETEEIGGFSFDSDGDVTEFIDPSSGTSVSGSFSVAKSGLVNGTMTLIATAGDANITFTFDCEGQFESETKLNLNATGTWSDNAGGSGDISFSASLSKDDFQHVSARLGYWPNATDKWWLMFHVYCKGATRVYATGEHISGEYDLYNCGDFGYCDVWWSANNAECVVGGNNYRLESEPELPFDVTVHIVRATGTVTETATISLFTTYYE